MRIAPPAQLGRQEEREREETATKSFVKDAVDNEIKNVAPAPATASVPSASSNELSSRFSVGVEWEGTWSVGNLGWDLNDQQILQRTDDVLRQCSIEAIPVLKTVENR